MNCINKIIENLTAEDILLTKISSLHREEKYEDMIEFYRGNFIVNDDNVVLLPKIEMELIVSQLYYFVDKEEWEGLSPEEKDEKIEDYRQLFRKCLEAILKHHLGQCSDEMFHDKLVENDFEEDFILTSIASLLIYTIFTEDTFYLVADLLKKYRNKLNNTIYDEYLLLQGIETDHRDLAIKILSQLGVNENNVWFTVLIVLFKQGYINEMLKFYKQTFLVKFPKVVLLPRAMMMELVSIVYYFSDRSLHSNDDIVTDETVEENKKLILPLIESIFHHLLGNCNDEIFHEKILNDDFKPRDIRIHINMYLDIAKHRSINRSQFRLITKMAEKYQDLMKETNFLMEIFEYAYQLDCLEEMIEFLNNIKFRDQFYYCLMGTVYTLMNEEAFAWEEFDKIINSVEDDEVGEIYNLISGLFFRKNKFENALIFIDRAIETIKVEALADLFAFKHHILLKLERVEEAYQAIEQAYTLDPKFDFIPLVVNAKLMNEKHKELLAFTEELSKKYPDHENIKYFHCAALLVNKKAQRGFDEMRILHAKTKDKELKQILSNHLDTEEEYYRRLDEED